MLQLLGTGFGHLEPDVNDVHVRAAAIGLM
jgi:hypothetical protein